MSPPRVTVPPAAAARSITSYFKPPSAGNSTSANSATATATPPKKVSTLSAAAKRAIADGVAARDGDKGNSPIAGNEQDRDGDGERSAKKAKLENTTPTKVAGIFAKPSPLTTSTKHKHFDSRAELREHISTNSHWNSLLKLELDTLGEDWLLALQDELTKPYFLNLKEFVNKEQQTKKVFPPAEDIYSWSRFCPLKDVRVVIIGQDPYHDDGQAHGLAFSVRKGIRIPPSLRNIYKQMADDIPGFVIPKHGDLSEWAKHGVLLLNTSLTVRAHEAGSHSNKGWDQFTAAVLRVVTSRLAPSTGSGSGSAASAAAALFAPKIKPASDQGGEEKKGTTTTTTTTTVGSSDHVVGGNGVVFMAWGAHAAKMCAGVDKNKHLILRSAHPSPLSASRGFLGNGHFKQANEWLVKRYGENGGIDWKVLSEDK